jgi:glycosyltransferase involved in cell wall biosynthesis
VSTDVTADAWSGIKAGDLRVLIIADHASARFGGEAILPLHYFKRLRARGIDVRLLVHERTREELTALFPDDLGRIYFVRDTRTHRLLDRIGNRLPLRLRHFTAGWLLRLLSQLSARRIGRRLVKDFGIHVIHQPIPVSPREPSLLYSMGAPVVIGPMNGGMTLPPGLREGGADDTRFRRVARRLSTVMNMLMPGKRRAALLLVANDRTQRALPISIKTPVVTLVENGVDLSLWSPPRARPHSAAAQFVFLGRLEDWKGVDLLIDAFAALPPNLATLDVIGDGPMRTAWEALARSRGLNSSVRFLGWQPQPLCATRLQSADALVLPSYYECGGAVVLEAMAASLPVIALAWGGPADYLDESCGILIPPHSRQQIIHDLRQAMLRLAQSPELRNQLGQAGRHRVTENFDWDRKIERILEIYQSAIRPKENAE